MTGDERRNFVGLREGGHFGKVSRRAIQNSWSYHPDLLPQKPAVLLHLLRQLNALMLQTTSIFVEFGSLKRGLAQGFGGGRHYGGLAL